MLTAELSDDKASTREGRWPVGVAFLTAWLLPATTARRTRHASLKQLWLVHCVSVLLTANTALFLFDWSGAGGGIGANVIVRVFATALRDIEREFDRSPGNCMLWLIGVALTIEFAAVLVALFLMPWGARDEGRWESYRNALRQVWLRTSHVFLIALVFGSAVVTSELMARTAIANAPLPWGNKYPWYVEYREPLWFAIGCAAALWSLWALLRSVGAHRDAITIVRPPTCEACGYNLTAIPMESRCPECGMAISSSLGPDVRPGTAWQNRATIGIVSAWCKTAFMAIQRPDELGHQLRTFEPGIDHRRFLAMHLPVVFGVGFLTLLVFALMSAPDDLFRDEFPMFLMVMTVFGLACVGGMVVLSLLAAATIGSFESYRYKRNLLPAAMQVASYLATYLTIWTVFGGATGLGVFWAEDAYFFRGMQDLTGVYHETLTVATWLVPNVACCLWFFLLLYRGTIGAAYANR